MLNYVIDIYLKYKATFYNCKHEPITVDISSAPASLKLSCLKGLQIFYNQL